MSSGGLYAIVTFCAGLLLLLGWLYITADNPRSTKLLFKSVVLFVLPGIVLVALPTDLFQFPLSMWLLVFVEECLKATAAVSEKDPRDRFWLVALFGVWELTLAKPLWGLNHANVLNGWDRLQLAGLTTAGIVTVLMHTVTAEIYAFRFPLRIPLALSLSWALHTAFNESVDLLGVSLIASLLQLLLLTLLFAALWPRGAYQSSSSS